MRLQALNKHMALCRKARMRIKVADWDRRMVRMRVARFCTTVCLFYLLSWSTDSRLVHLVFFLCLQQETMVQDLAARSGARWSVGVANDGVEAGSSGCVDGGMSSSNMSILHLRYVQKIDLPNVSERGFRPWSRAHTFP